MNPLPSLALPALSLPDLSSTLDPIGSAASAAASTVNAIASGSGVADVAAKTLLGIPLSNIVIIVIGLLLIAAGIFGFDKTREVIMASGKAALAA